MNTGEQQRYELPAIHDACPVHLDYVELHLLLQTACSSRLDGRGTVARAAPFSTGYPDAAPEWSRTGLTSLPEP